MSIEIAGAGVSTTLIPTALEERFALEVIHRGEMSTVYLGRDRHTGTDVILKTAPLSDDNAASTLRRERDILVRLHHRGIVRCLDLIEDSGVVALVLERVPGVDLEHVMKERTRIDEVAVRDWGGQLADILCYLHQQQPPLIFRDIKPANIMLRPDGRLVLIDFGAARARSEAPKDTIALGTPGYAPPEQYGRATDERADVYALGVTLFELLCGRDPRAFNFAFPPLNELGIDVSPELAALVQRAVHPDAQQRFASVEAMRDALGRRPVRFPVSQVLAIGGTLVCAAGVASASLPSARFGMGVGVFVCATWAGMAGVAPAPDDRPRWQRFTTRATVVALAALLGAAPFALPQTSFNAHLRRLGMDLFNAPVALDGSSPLLFGCAALLGVLGFLYGRGLVRRLSLSIPLALAAFAATLLGGHLALDSRHDLASSATFNDPPPLWSRDLGPGNAQMEALSLHTDPQTGRSRLFLQTTAYDYVVLDASDGTEVFRGHTQSREPMHVEGNGEIVERDGQRFVMRSVLDGQARWSWTSDQPVQQFMTGESRIYVQDGSRIRAFDSRTMGSTAKPLWTWTASTPEPPMMMGQADGGIFLVTSGQGATITGLDGNTGQAKWTATLPIRSLGPCWWGENARFWTGDGRLCGIDTRTGARTFQTALPFAEANFMMPMGQARYLLVSGSNLCAIDSRSGQLLWKAAAPGEHLTLCATPPDGALLQTDSGHLLRLEADTGRVRWEWWGGGTFLGHVTSDSTPPVYSDMQPEAHFIQAEPGGPLYAIDGTSGRVLWVHRVPERCRVVRVIENDRSLLLVTSDASQNRTLVALPRPAELSGIRPDGAPHPGHPPRH